MIGLNVHRIVIDKSSMTLPQAINRVKSKIINNAASACALGYYLITIRDYELYRESDRYKQFIPEEYQTSTGILKFTKYTFYDFCKDEFGFSRRSVDRYMFICQEFSKKTDLGDVSRQIDDKYNNYSISALAELLQLSDKQRSQVTSETSVKDIRELKNNKADVDVGPATAPPDDQTQPSDTWSAISPKDVNVDDCKLMQTKTFKKHKYKLASDEFDRYVDDVSSYTAAYKDVSAMLKKGYLVRLVLYKPEV